jgi:hypothetical protein
MGTWPGSTASRLGVDRSTVARHVVALEKELGLPPFERGPQGWSQTGAGQELAELAGRVEEEVLAMARHVAARSPDPNARKNRGLVADAGPIGYAPGGMNEPVPPGTRGVLELSRMAVALLLLASAGLARAQGTSFFGPQQGFEIQPEIDVYWHVADGLRLLLQVQDTAIPSESNNTLAVGGFVDWFVAPVLRELVSPDRSLTHALNLRLGVRYRGTLDPGTVGPAESVAVRLEVTPRFFAPWEILLSNRNRFQVNWNLGGSDSVTYIYRGRLQAQREFDVGDVALTPFLNVEFVWQSPPAKWNQFRMEAGLQASVHWFGRGQTFEVNYSTVTNLQPSRSWRPVLGIIWYQYF